ncbi:DNA recombination protein RmuC [Patescibacteria group bacterium]|nr:DNA recombination protein RmuC [Patescibacteria group bacterium]
MIYILFIILFIILLGGFAGLFYFFNNRFKELKEKNNQDGSFLMLNQNLQNFQNSVSNRLEKTSDIISQLNKELGGMKEIGHQMQLFQDFLKSPKARGGIGEQVLKNLLEQYFSKQHFSFQHKFKTGKIVDAILKTKEGIIPIDSKFSLDNFRKLIKAKSTQEEQKIKKLFIRDIKNHIDSISKKYILPDEGTVDFAVMYVPSEAVYYEIIKMEEKIDDYAREKMVYFVSPNSFYYFLRIIMIGMQGQEIQENSKQLLRVLTTVQKDMSKFNTILGLVNTHINNAKNAVDQANNQYTKLMGKVDQVKLLK